MEYQKISINTASPLPVRARVMIIYTGGTAGMVADAHGTLRPFDFSLILQHIPTLRNLMLELTVISFNEPVDSSNIGPREWVTLAEIVESNYNNQDGFVILHGTDTMAYTASALSFMLSGLNKPVIFTGAQLSITHPRSDARENLITALEIASMTKDGNAFVPEVCIYFGNQLLRGNRSKKAESNHFDAFQSENYPPLARAGVKIEFNNAVIRTASADKLRIRKSICSDVSILKIFPGITPAAVNPVLNAPGIKGVVIETFGSGNAPTARWFIDALSSAIKSGVIIVNVSQCPGGMVQQGRYETSKELAGIGVIGGGDMTTEAAITKLMLGLGELKGPHLLNWLQSPVAGERS
jgi:L-asparaginase